jgi:type I restriction enzyme, S subunit
MRLPIIAEQSAIATALTDMDAEIAALEAPLALKKGMMQELLTGRTRPV